MQAKTIANKIRAYRTASVAWYTNQASETKLKQANRLERTVERLIHNYYGAARDRLINMYMRATWACGGQEPHR